MKIFIDTANLEQIKEANSWGILDGVTTNPSLIAPGAFDSEMMDGMLSRIGGIWKAFPRKRVASPELMDSTLLYLVAPSSEAVTGTVIKIDDGQGPK